MRGRILDAAAGLSQMRGHHSTSTRDIVRKAGVTAGALHHHLRTKKDIGLAVIRERVAKAVEQTWIDPVQSAKTATDGILTAFDRVAAGKKMIGERRRLILAYLTGSCAPRQSPNVGIVVGDQTAARL